MTSRAAASRALAALVGVFVLAGGCLASRAEAQQMQKPRIEPVRIVGETVLGGYAGIGGFILGRFVFEESARLVGADHDVTVRRIGFLGGVIGGGLATAGVVYTIGNLGDQQGDFDATYLGTGIGFVAALGVAKMILGPGGRPPEGMSTASRWATANVIALLPAIGATIGFNSTRRYR